MAFPPESLEIWVDTREYSHPIETATYPPFTKGTSMFACTRGMHSTRGACLCSGVKGGGGKSTYLPGFCVCKRRILRTE